MLGTRLVSAIFSDRLWAGSLSVGFPRSEAGETDSPPECQLEQGRVESAGRSSGAAEVGGC